MIEIQKIKNARLQINLGPAQLLVLVLVVAAKQNVTQARRRIVRRKLNKGRGVGQKLGHIPLRRPDILVAVTVWQNLLNANQLVIIEIEYPQRRGSKEQFLFRKLAVLVQ